MKKHFKALSLFACVFVLAMVLMAGVSATGSTTNYYVDSVAGSDTNNGLSAGSAWASLAKINESSFQPGDSILFKRGCVFVGFAGLHGSGTAENPITIDAYGEGDTPLLTTLEAQTVLAAIDESNWVIKNLEITAPNGNGILVRFEKKVVKNFLIENITMHDIRNYPSNSYYSGSNAALRIMGSAIVAGAHIEDVRVNNCEIYDVGYGIFTGCNFPNTPDTPYNKNIIVENCSLHDMFDDAFIMSDTDGIILRNSSIINTTQSDGLYATAPVWLWGVNNGLVENCEFAGSKNKRDGMTVDFDAYTNNSTYQYVYSHDNVRFMNNCPTATDAGNNTVRYCLSVNDNIIENGGAFYKSPELGLKFYNNTLINSSSYKFKNYNNATVKNNIFFMKSGSIVNYSIERKYELGNNCYYNTYQPIFDLLSKNANPLFADKDWSDKNSFVLQPGSPCYKTGTQVEENMGTRDFYGNPLGSRHSIGCFDGELEGTASSEVMVQKLFGFFIRIVDFIKGFS